MRSMPLHTNDPHVPTRGARTRAVLWWLALLLCLAGLLGLNAWLYP
ncbi:MAG: hypothetical protein IPJ87_16470 [Flavobacteriales bacterium]|jgi:hypothetical protein|nr:hypothetical protein [Flavobacteriales bacterium]MBK7943443.1 hypothetical protein [Flavobacteriales bacterium]MBK8948094.1 hypothetical protein [Flavobacteriales bacterium]MBK9699868.1 hypothetical protein [Flavobacteriales bacterium]